MMVGGVRWVDGSGGRTCGREVSQSARVAAMQPNRAGQCTVSASGELGRYAEQERSGDLAALHGVIDSDRQDMARNWRTRGSSTP